MFEKLEIRPPYYVIPSLLNVRSLKLVYLGYDGEKKRERVINHDHLLLPEVRIDNTAPALEQLFRPSFEVLWNSGGWWRAPHYDKAGNYLPRWRDHA